MTSNGCAGSIPALGTGGQCVECAVLFTLTWQRMKVCVVGAGYVGLVMAACFAARGHSVQLVETDRAKRRLLQAGHCPIYEAKLPHLLQKSIAAGRLFFTDDLKAAALESSFIFLTLPTPPLPDGSADVSILLSVVEAIARFFAGEKSIDSKVIVNKSTVPVGTAQRMETLLVTQAMSHKRQVSVVSNPEFLREGFAVADFMAPSRIIIGTSSRQARQALKELYAPIVRRGVPFVFTDTRSAELTKCACNALLATKVSFINEIAAICERTGADVEEVRKGMGLDNRIGDAFLSAGMGYGGGCLPKDMQALIRCAIQTGFLPRVMVAAQQTNWRQRTLLSHMVLSHFKTVKGKVLAVWGLSFKAGTDDMRASPAVANIEVLLREGAIIQAHDPVAINKAAAQFGERVLFYEDAYQAAQGAEALLIMTDWAIYRRPAVNILTKKMRRRLIFDGRNIYTPQQVKRWGYSYFSVGRAPLLS